MRMTWIGSAWNALIVLIVLLFAVVGVGVGVVAAVVVVVVVVGVGVVAFVAFVARCAACSGLGAANSAACWMIGVASGTFLALATTTATQSTRRRAVRSQAPGGARFHRVQPGLSDG